jgi:hypothetical protein
MRDYEICLINLHGAPSLFFMERYFSDAAAIHAAKHLCKEGEVVEVWRMDIRIYAEAPRKNVPLARHDLSRRVFG